MVRCVPPVVVGKMIGSDVMKTGRPTSRLRECGSGGRMSRVHDVKENVPLCASGSTFEKTRNEQNSSSWFEEMASL